MAFGKLLIIFAVAVLAFGNINHEVEAEAKAKKAMAAEKDQKSRSANPGRERGSFQKLSNLTFNDRKHNRRQKNSGMKGILDIYARDQKHDMLNDKDSDFAINKKTISDNKTDALNEKIKVLNSMHGQYEAMHKVTPVPLVIGVFCNFEPPLNSSLPDLCMWGWNSTRTTNGLGFQVLTPADVKEISSSDKNFKFTGPDRDADGNVTGHFLYLAVDPTMGSMTISSPPFRGLQEFCKCEVYLHQSRMQNASIKLVSESSYTGVQWVLQEVTGNNAEMWSKMVVLIGKMEQELRIIIEVTRPSYINTKLSLPYIAVDNIRMVDCLPDGPIGDNCVEGLFKCNISRIPSCIKLQQVCDLVADCDDDSDESANCDKMPLGSYCNFETGPCGFTNVPQPVLKWALHHGPTPTEKTGPDYDHTCGPISPTPTPPVPPLAPANHSLSKCPGYYFFVNMNVTGPNNETAGFASTAVMKTVVFNPPPKVHGNLTSQYYNSCMIRFYYQQNGRNYGSLSVDLIELTSRGNVSTNIWFSTKNKGDKWHRANIFLPNVTRRYYLEFKTRMGMRIYSDSAIDDFSMTPECFGLNIDPKLLGNYNYYDPVFEEKTTPHRAFVGQKYYRFTTCGATGRFGPSQAQCAAAYNRSHVAVRVAAGVQVWEVPDEGLYTIIATGASGGLGSAWAGVSHAAAARGLFALHRGQLLHLMVGQQGTNACKKTLSAQESQVCSIARQNDSLQYTSKTHEVRNTEVIDGGGGGGGGTFVFVMDKSGSPRPLLVAGGGGGISVGVFRDDSSQHARTHTNATPENGHMYGPPGRTSGAGGGWVSGGMVAGALAAAGGRAAADGGGGGAACVGAAHGGFGGGGGGCLKGGGGGGWRGGSTSEQESLHGGGGWSLTGGLSGFSAAYLAPRTGPGEVLVIPAIYSPTVCGCDYRCVALDERRRVVRCYCPGAWTLTAHNHTTCLLEDTWQQTSYLVIVGLSVTVLMFVLLTLGGCLYLYNIFQRKRQGELRQKHRVEQELQLQRLRNTPGGDNSLIMAFNPHYGSEGFLPQGIDVRGLPQVSRESLKLVKALGQGAFGEVYQGLYRHRVNDSVEMPVAVKTLPELSTGQAESDFLMEAAIMAKFNHPNIVHLIGVCFDRHPRFIVLELLAGGDLKNFLRESRPKAERVTALTMKDLLLCSLDVCKGCKYLEAQRFIHRDIAARNCLLTSRGPGRVVKIADFGMARDIYRADYYKKGGKAMLPIKWMPPEAYMDGVFTSKTDVWSFAVLVWEVFSLGVMPYTGCANREVMDMVSNGGRLEKPYGCPPEIYRMMCDCWNPEPKDRPTFSYMFDKLQSFLQDPEIVSAPLPLFRSTLPPTTTQPIAQCSPADYLVPLTTQSTPTDANSSTDAPVAHSTTPTVAQRLEMEDSRYPPLLKASQDYGNIPMGCRGGSRESASGSSGADSRNNTKFLPSNSTDRLLSSIERNSLSDSEDDITDDRAVWETSFTEPRRNSSEARKHFAESKNSGEVKSFSDSRQNSEVRKKSLEAKRTDSGPAVEKLISITPTSPKPPENVLSAAVKGNIMDNSNLNTLMPEPTCAPIASPDPPRINACLKDPSTLTPKPKPLCLDAAQLEQNLNALKKNSGSVNLNTMNILPPYINVVTPNKRSESKTIQIDPKKAIIHDLQSPKTPEPEPERKLKQSHSAASLLNGPMTDVPYADSDNASSSSSGKQNNIKNMNNKNYTEVIVNDKTKLTKQGSNGIGDASEISC